MAVEPKHGWGCPLCGQIYEFEDDAKDCIDTHVEYPVQRDFVLGGEYPINLRIWKEVAGKAVAYQDYIKDGPVRKIRQ